MCCKVLRVYVNLPPHSIDSDPVQPLFCTAHWCTQHTHRHTVWHTDHSMCDMYVKGPYLCTACEWCSPLLTRLLSGALWNLWNNRTIMQIWPVDRQKRREECQQPRDATQCNSLSLCDQPAQQRTQSGCQPALRPVCTTLLSTNTHTYTYVCNNYELRQLLTHPIIVLSSIVCRQQICGIKPHQL